MILSYGKCARILCAGYASSDVAASVTVRASESARIAPVNKAFGDRGQSLFQDRLIIGPHLRAQATDRI